MINEQQHLTSVTGKRGSSGFGVGIFPPGLLFGLTGNRPQSAACVYLPTL